jgi:hypothetical protein
MSQLLNRIFLDFPENISGGEPLFTMSQLYNHRNFDAVAAVVGITDY